MIGIAPALERLQAAVLEQVPSAEWCVGLRFIAGETGIHTEIVRGVIAELRELGFVDYHRGLMNEDGIVAGSGYSLTLAGADWLRRFKGEAAPFDPAAIGITADNAHMFPPDVQRLLAEHTAAGEADG